jgi:hypothetical protein
MTTTQWLLNVGLLIFILATNLGTRPVTPRRLIIPLVMAAASGLLFLTNVPVLGNDLTLDIIGAGTGVLLGAVAGLLMHLQRTPDGSVVSKAGAAYALLWIAVVGGRVTFAESATGWARVPIRDFSISNQITGTDAWTAAFIIMALAMVVARVATTAIRQALIRHTSPVPVPVPAHTNPA